MSQRFSPRLFHCDQRGVHWLWQPGPSALRHMMTECGPDGNLCCALKDGSVGDYQGRWEQGVVWHNQKVMVPRKEYWARNREACSRPFTL